MPRKPNTQKKPIRFLLAAIVVAIILALILLLRGTHHVATNPSQATAGAAR